MIRTILRHRAPVVLAVFALAATMLVLQLLGTGRADADESYLANFRLAPPVSDQLADLRATGNTGPIYIPERSDPADTKPEKHGVYLLVPEGWIGPVEPSRPIADSPPVPGPDSASSDTDELMASDLWREPRHIPDGFEFAGARSDAIGYNLFEEFVLPARDGSAGYEGKIEVIIWRPILRPVRVLKIAEGQPGANMYRTIEIDGMSAIVWESENGGIGFGVNVRAFDDDTGIEYAVDAFGIDAEHAIEILRSLYQ